MKIYRTELTVHWNANLVRSQAFLVLCLLSASASCQTSTAIGIDLPTAPLARSKVSANELGQCVSMFKDPKYYNWISFKNDCQETIHVTFAVVGNAAANGSMTLRPGQSDNTGRSSKETPNGFVFAVCGDGYRATSVNGGRWVPDAEGHSCRR